MGSKKFLILTADVGFGHRNAAKALVAALTEVYGENAQVFLVNPLEDKRAPAILRDSQSDYDRMVRQMPDVYKLQYQISDSPVPNSIMEKAFTVMLFQIIQDVLRRYHPDVVVTTHPMFTAPLTAVIATSKSNVPYLTVVTDLVSVHRMWFNEGAELTFVPTEDAQATGIEIGIPVEKIQIAGIPVNPKIAQEKRIKAEIRHDLGVNPDLRTALVVGSKRVNHLRKVLDVLNHSGHPLQWLLVAGGDDQLFQWMQANEWHGVTHCYNYVENLPEMLSAADLVISKAGGLITTEALASGLPLLYIDVTPGQEEGNAEYVIKNGAGERARTPLEALETICHWLAEGGKLLEERSRAARVLGRPRAAYTIADFIWAAAERGPLPVPENRRALLPKIMELLDQFGLAGESTAQV